MVGAKLGIERKTLSLNILQLLLLRATGLTGCKKNIHFTCANTLYDVVGYGVSGVGALVNIDRTIV